MPRVSLAFFSVAALCGLTGMVMGTIMGISQDFTQSPTHAHLNLVGWASLAIMGTFYTLAGAKGRLPWINFTLSSLGAALMVPGLYVSLANGHTINPALMAGPVVLVLGMLTFVIAVLSRWRSAPSA